MHCNHSLSSPVLQSSSSGPPPTVLIEDTDTKLIEKFEPLQDWSESDSIDYPSNASENNSDSSSLTDTIVLNDAVTTVAAAVGLSTAACCPSPYLGISQSHDHIMDSVYHQNSGGSSHLHQDQIDMDGNNSTKVPLRTIAENGHEHDHSGVKLDHPHANGRITRMMSSFRRKTSSASMRSDTRPHELLQNFGKKLQRTHSQLKRTRLLHIFYMMALPVYTLLGAVIFKALDGDHDDQALKTYENRCEDVKRAKMAEILANCSGKEFDLCIGMVNGMAQAVDKCFRDWHAKNRAITHPLSEFTNAIVYAFSVYTTIGYGNMAADTTQCRVATVIYGVFGIPLFFAFVKEEGNLFRYFFIKFYGALRRLKRRLRRRWYLKRHRNGNHILSSTHSISLDFGKPNRTRSTPAAAVNTDSDYEQNNKITSVLKKRRSFNRQKSSASQMSATAGLFALAEQRKVFLSGVVVFIVYLLGVSGVFCLMTEWDLFTAFYFLFNSVALIGFGDVFPSEPKVVLTNLVLIVLGVVLFSMCYFILQEEIREKAFEASRRARMSISKYGQTLWMHTRTNFSRRNSPFLDGANFEMLKRRRQSAPAMPHQTTGDSSPNSVSRKSALDHSQEF